MPQTAGSAHLQECEQLGRRPVVCQVGGLDALSAQERFEQGAAHAAALAALVHVKVQHAQWLNLDHGAIGLQAGAQAG